MNLRQLFSEILPDNRLPETQVTSVTCDSRQVQRGSVFVCVRGSRGDGHNHVAQALERGAALVVAQTDCGIPNQLLFADTREVYSRLCAAFFGHPANRMRLIAITGTNGKTTTAWLVQHALEQLGHKAGLIGTICNKLGAGQVLPARYTTPDPWELHGLFSRMLQNGCTEVVMEASSHALEQRRLEGCRFACGVFTNLSPEHLDYHPDLESYFQAKARLFSMCDTAALNGADVHGQRLYRQLERKLPLLSFGEGQQLSAQDVRLYADRCEMTLVYGQQNCYACLRMPGQFSVENLLAAVAALLQCGFKLEESVNAVCSCQGVPGRTEVCISQDGITVLRDYAHTPDSLQKVLDTVRGFCKGRLIVVFGCPGRRDRQKRPLMAKAVCERADLLVMTADNPREEPLEQIFADSMPGLAGAGRRARVIADRRDAISWAIGNSRAGDIVLLAGKGHEDYQVLEDRTICFDEKEIVMQIFSQRCADKR